MGIVKGGLETTSPSLNTYQPLRSAHPLTWAPPGNISGNLGPVYFRLTFCRFLIYNLASSSPVPLVFLRHRELIRCNSSDSSSQHACFAIRITPLRGRSLRESWNVFYYLDPACANTAFLYTNLNEPKFGPLRTIISRPCFLQPFKALSSYMRGKLSETWNNQMKARTFFAIVCTVKVAKWGLAVGEVIIVSKSTEQAVGWILALYCNTTHFHP